MKLFEKYKFPLKVVKSGTLCTMGSMKDYLTEDDNHILDSNDIEVLGTSEWLRFDDEDAEEIVKILNNAYYNTFN